MKSNEADALKEVNKRQAEVIDDLSRQVLVAELKAHPDAKDCPNPEFLARVIIKDNNFGANAETGTLQAHLDEERLHPSSLTLDAIIAMMKSDPESAILFTPRPEKWTPPAENPWRKATFNLTIQGQVVKHDPELAEKLKTEAKKWDAVHA